MADDGSSTDSDPPPNAAEEVKMPTLPAPVDQPAEGGRAKKGGAKSSPYRGVTLFRPTMKWRAQISAGGKTTSLGDHDTEEDAARAFDRAAINKGGLGAKTNFPLSQYADEIDDLKALSQTEMVAMLRSKARKTGVQTSHYRGVSLLKQTHKWHAQINVGGKQVHLGFFSTEEGAARAYDRAAINKGARDAARIITNLAITDYSSEMENLRRITPSALVEAMCQEPKRLAMLEMLANGSIAAGEKLFGSNFDTAPHLPGVLTVDQILEKAERAQPKPTANNPLYANFGKKREGGEIVPIITRPPNFPPPKPRTAQQYGRRQTQPRKAVEEGEASSGESDEEGDEDFEAQGGENAGPTRRSARNVGKAAIHYSNGEDDEEVEGEENHPSSPRGSTIPPSSQWATTSPNHRHRRKPRARKPANSDDESDDEKKAKQKKRDAAPVVVEPVAPPCWDLLAYAVMSAQQSEDAKESPKQRLRPGLQKKNAAQVPSMVARLDSSGAATAGSLAGVATGGPFRPSVADKCSQAAVGQARGGGDHTPAVTVEPLETRPSLEQGPGTPSVAQPKEETPGTAARLGATGEDAAVLRGGSAGEKGSIAPAFDKASILAGLGQGGQGDKVSDAAIKLSPVKGSGPGSVKGASPEEAAAPSGEATPQPSAANGTGKRQSGARKRKEADSKAAEGEQGPAKRGKGKGAHSAAAEEKPLAAKPMTKRQRALMESQELKKGSPAASSMAGPQEERGLSPRLSFAASAAPQPPKATRQSKARSSKKGGAANRVEEDAASQSSPQAQVKANFADSPEISDADSQGSKEAVAEPAKALPRGTGNRRKRKLPARSGA